MEHKTQNTKINLLDYMVKWKIKQADLKIIRLFSDSIHSATSTKNVCSYYQAQEIIPRLIELDVLKMVGDGKYITNKENEFVKKLLA